MVDWKSVFGFLICLVLLSAGQAIFAETSNGMSSELVDLKERVFKLRIETGPEVIDDLRYIPRIKPVESSLIDQINKVRQTVPSWHGMHRLLPGSSSRNP